MASALGELGAEDRALVELAEVRGIGDEEMAGYLGVAPAEARERRRVALERLAGALGVSAEQARSELTEALPPESPRSGAAIRPRGPQRPRPVAHRPRESRARPVAPARHPRDRRRQSAALFAVLGVLLLAGALTIALASAGDGGGGEAGPKRSAVGEPDMPTSQGPKVELQPPGPGPGTGTAQVLAGGDRVAVKISGLPDPGSSRYAVWLYDSLLKARQIASADRGDFAVEARLPSGAARYDLLDVSLEPDDGNPQHSGQSVLRAPVKKLIAP